MQLSSTKNLAFAVTTLTLLGCGVTTAAHAQFSGGPGFVSTYIGPQGGDLEVSSATAADTGANLVLTSTFLAPVGTTTGAFYVWGVDTGTGTSNFAALGATQDESGVVFNSVILAHPFADSITTTPSLKVGGTTLPNSDMVVSGSTLTLTVPFSVLASTGFVPQSYLVNLWPRFEGTFNSVNVTGNAQISQFAPNNRDSAITNATAPEPSSFLLLAGPMAGAASFLIRRRKSRARQ